MRNWGPRQRRSHSRSHSHTPLITCDELSVCLDTMPVCMDARDAEFIAMSAASEKWFERIEATLIGIRKAIVGVQVTVVVTAIASVLALAVFNATVLSKMVVSFDADRETAALAERETSEIIRWCKNLPERNSSRRDQ